MEKQKSKLTKVSQISPHLTSKTLHYIQRDIQKLPRLIAYLEHKIMLTKQIAKFLYDRIPYDTYLRFFKCKFAKPDYLPFV